MGRITQAVYLIGAYKIVTQLAYTAQSMLNNDQSTLKGRLNEKYGAEGEWAVITGASEGIGRAYALELAKAGYNIKVCARSVDKLQRVVEEARALNPAIETEVVQLDVSNVAPSAYQALFDEKNRTSIVINNAGIMKNRYLLDTDPCQLEAMIKTNVHPYVFMTKYALQHFKASRDSHQHKNALLYTSSLAAMAQMPNTAVYSGTKTHNYVFARLVAEASRKSATSIDLVDFQTLHPAGVSTNLNGFKKVQADCVTPNACAVASLCDLGNNTMSIFGAIEHTFLGRIALPLINWSPEVNKHFGNKRSSDPHFIRD